MSILLAAKSPNAKTSHPLFIQRNLANYTQAPLNAVHFGGITHLKELAYDGYKGNIDTFIAATNLSRKIMISEVDLHLTNLQRPLPLLPMPPVGFIPAAAMTPDQETAFLAKLLPYNTIAKKRGKTTFFIVNAPVPKLIPALLKVGKEDARVEPEFLTPLAYQSLVIVHRIISEFLATNTYPAWVNEEFDYAKFDSRWELLSENICHDIVKRRGSNWMVPATKVAKTMKESEPAEQETDKEEEDEYEEADAMDLDVIEGRNPRENVLVAKPSFQEANNNIGSPADVPFLPGLCFPYFDRMNIPDRVTVRNIISSRFLRNLGPTREEQVANFRKLRDGLDEIHTRREGGVLAHLMVGIELSLQTQTRLFVVMVSGDYSGFVLLGARFSVVVNGEKSDAMSPEDLQIQLSKMSSHSAALSDICEQLSKMKIVTGAVKVDPVPVTPEMVPTAMALWKSISLRDTSTAGSSWKIVQERIGLLSYDRAYLSPSVESITKALARISLQDKTPLAEDTPLFLPTQALLYNDATAKILAMFGPMAFSFINTTGNVYQIQKSSEKDPNRVMAEGDKRPVLWCLPISIKPLHVAVGDMKKFFKDKACVADLKERAKANRTIIVAGEQLDTLYEKMREALWFEDEASSKKRKAKAQDGRDGGAKRPETAEEAIALFDFDV